MVLPILYIILPFAFISLGIVHYGHFYAFYIASAVLLGVMIHEGFPKIKNKYIMAFFIYFSCLVLFACISNTYGNVKDPHKTRLSIVAVFYYLSATVIYLAVAGSKLKKKVIYNAICISALIQTVIANCQYFGFYPVAELLGIISNVKDIKMGGTITGTLGNSNFLGAYLAISAPFFFREKWFFFLTLVIPTIIITSASTAVISLLIGVAIFYDKGIKFILMAISMGIAYFVIFDWVKLVNILEPGHRPIMWINCLTEFKSLSKVLFGFGVWSESARKGLLHNEYLSAFHRFGAVGFIIIAGFIREKLKHFKLMEIMTGDRILYSSIIVSLVNIAGNPALHFAPTMFLIIMIFGLAERDQINGRLPNTCRHKRCSPKGN